MKKPRFMVGDCVKVVRSVYAVPGINSDLDDDDVEDYQRLVGKTGKVLTVDDCGPGSAIIYDLKFPGEEQSETFYEEELDWSPIKRIKA